MSNPSFQAAKLLFSIISIINAKKIELSGLIVSNIKNLEKKQQLMNQLIQLIDYEKQIISRLNNFEYEIDSNDILSYINVDLQIIYNDHSKNL